LDHRSTQELCKQFELVAFQKPKIAEAATLYASVITGKLQNTANMHSLNALQNPYS
jgi:hypothetical protein